MKLIAFIFVGIIIGASIGIGAVYLFILPNVVKPRMEELSQRLSDVESSMSTLADVQGRAVDRLSRAEDAIESISPLASRVSSIEESISRLDILSRRISVVENSTISIESEIDVMSDHLLSLQESLDYIYYSDIVGLQEDIASLEYNLTELVSEVDKKVRGLVSDVDEIVIALEEDLAYKLLKKALAEQDGDVATLITDEIFNDLKASSTIFIQWINLVGSENVKNVLGNYIDTQLPTFMWHDQYISKVNTHKYMTYVISYFPIIIDTGLSSIGEITIPRVSLIIVGTINVAKKRVSSIGIEFLKI